MATKDELNQQIKQNALQKIKQKASDYIARGVGRVKQGFKDDPGQYSFTRAMSNVVPATQIALSPVNYLKGKAPTQFAQDMSYGLRGATQFTPFQAINYLGIDKKGQQQYQASAPQTDRQKMAQGLGRSIYGLALTSPIGAGSKLLTPSRLAFNAARNAMVPTIGGGAIAPVINTAGTLWSEKRLPTIQESLASSAQGAIQGFKSSPILAITNPITSKVVNSFLSQSTLGTLGNQIVQRGIGGTANVIEDEIINKVDDVTTTNSERVLSFALGALMTGNTDLKNNLNKVDRTKLAANQPRNKGMFAKQAMSLTNYLKEQYPSFSKDKWNELAPYIKGQKKLNQLSPQKRNLVLDIQYKIENYGKTLQNVPTETGFERLVLKKNPPSEAMGLLAGIEPEYDEEGNIVGYKYNPEKGMVGVAGLIGGRKALNYANTRQFSAPTDKLPRFEIDDSGAKIDLSKSMAYLNQRFIHQAELGNVLKHDALFKQYPEAKKWEVAEIQINPNLEKPRGEFYISFGKPTLKIKAKNEKEATNLLLHEIQHGIQEIENFAKGGSLEGLEEAKKQLSKQSKVKIENDYDVYRRLSGELEARAVQRRMDLPADQRGKIDPYAEEAIATTGKADPREFITRFESGSSASVSGSQLTQGSQKIQNLLAQAQTPEDALKILKMLEQAANSQERFQILKKALKEYRKRLVTGPGLPQDPDNKAIIDNIDDILIKKISDIKPLKNAGVSQPPKGVGVDLTNKPQQLNVNKLNLDEQGKTIVRKAETTEPRLTLKNKEIKKQANNAEARTIANQIDETANISAKDLKLRQEIVADTNEFMRLKNSGADENTLLKQMKKIQQKSKVSRQAGTDIARQLQARNILAEETSTPMQKVFKLLDNAGVKESAYIKDSVKVNWDNANSVTAFYRKYVPAKWHEWLDEYRYSNMLSSPNTQINNAFSNALQTAIVTPVEKTIAGGIDLIKSKLTGSEQKYFVRQGADYSKGYIKSLPDAVRNFKKALSGQTELTNLDLKRMPTSTSGISKIYTTPLRLLEASDQFFKTLVKGGELESLKRAGLSSEEALKKAEQSAEYRLFRQKFDPEGELGQGGLLKVWDSWNSKVENLRNAPGGKWIVPFLKTPTNILKQGVEYSPAGFATAIGAKNPIEQLAKASVGTAVFSVAYGMAESGLTTWDTPTNAKERAEFYDAGLQPYSVKIGDKWVSYSKLGPLAYPIAMASAMKWAKDNGLSDDKMVKAGTAMGGVLGFFADQSYMKGLGDIIDGVRGDEFKRDRAISNIPSQLVPYRSLQGWFARLLDPVYRKSTGENLGETVLNSIKSQTPFLSKTLPAYETPSGEPSRRQFPGVNAVSPLSITKEDKVKVINYNTQKEIRKQNRLVDLAKEELKENNQEYGEVGSKLLIRQPDGSVNTFDTSTVSEVASMPTKTRYQQEKRQETVTKMVTKINGLRIEENKKNQLYDILGVDPAQARYYAMTQESVPVRTGIIYDQMEQYAQNGDRVGMLQMLITGRNKVFGGQLVSDSVIDQIKRDGYLTDAEAKQLKGIQVVDGQIRRKLTGRVAKPKTIKFRKQTSKTKRIKIRAPKIKSTL